VTRIGLPDHRFLSFYFKRNIFNYSIASACLSSACLSSVPYVLWLNSASYS